MAKISVIVPIYKVEPYLHRCVDSILGQTFKDFELILVDDGSPDRCGEICEEYAKLDRRVVVIHRENGGLSAARNSGIDWAFSHSRSKYFTFVDSDDWLHETYLEVLLWGCSKENANISICGFTRTDGRNCISVDYPSNSWHFASIGPEGFLRDCWEWKECGAWTCNVAWGKLYARKCFEEIRYPENIRAHEDVFTTYKLVFAEQRVTVTHIPLYYYYVNSESITGVKWSVARLNAVYGDKEQVEFFSSHRFNVALEIILRWYFIRLADAIVMVKRNLGKCSELDRLMGMLRTDFNHYRKIYDYPIKQYYCVYRVAKPVSSYFKYKVVRFTELLCGGKLIPWVLRKIGLINDR